MVTKNPCRGCEHACIYKSKHYPSNRKQCLNCDVRSWYEYYMESRRQYRSGEPITDINTLLNQRLVMWYGKIKNIEVIRSMSIRTVEMFLKHGAFSMAVRKEEPHESTIRL